MDITKKTVTSSERLQLIGLTTLAARVNAQQSELIRAAAAIIGEGEDNEIGYGSDLISQAGFQGDPVNDVDRTLRHMEIEVRDA